MFNHPPTKWGRLDAHAWTPSVPSWPVSSSSNIWAGTQRAPGWTLRAQGRSASVFAQSAPESSAASTIAGGSGYNEQLTCQSATSLLPGALGKARAVRGAPASEAALQAPSQHVPRADRSRHQAQPPLARIHEEPHHAPSGTWTMQPATPQDTGHPRTSQVHAVVHQSSNPSPPAQRPGARGAVSPQRELLQRPQQHLHHKVPANWAGRTASGAGQGVDAPPAGQVHTPAARPTSPPLGPALPRDRGGSPLQGRTPASQSSQRQGRSAVEQHRQRQLSQRSHSPGRGGRQAGGSGRRAPAAAAPGQPIAAAQAATAGLTPSETSRSPFAAHTARTRHRGGYVGQVPPLPAPSPWVSTANRGPDGTSGNTSSDAANYRVASVPAGLLAIAGAHVGAGGGAQAGHVPVPGYGGAAAAAATGGALQYGADQDLLEGYPPLDELSAEGGWGDGIDGGLYGYGQEYGHVYGGMALDDDSYLMSSGEEDDYGGHGDYGEGGWSGAGGVGAGADGDWEQQAWQGGSAGGLGEERAAGVRVQHGPAGMAPAVPAPAAAASDVGLGAPDRGAVGGSLLVAGARRRGSYKRSLWADAVEETGLAPSPGGESVADAGTLETRAVAAAAAAATAATGAAAAAHTLPSPPRPAPDVGREKGSTRRDGAGEQGSGGAGQPGADPWVGGRGAQSRGAQGSHGSHVSLDRLLRLLRHARSVGELCALVQEQQQRMGLAHLGTAMRSLARLVEAEASAGVGGLCRGEQGGGGDGGVVGVGAGGGQPDGGVAQAARTLVGTAVQVVSAQLEEQRLLRQRQQQQGEAAVPAALRGERSDADGLLQLLRFALPLGVAPSPEWVMPLLRATKPSIHMLQAEQLVLLLETLAQPDMWPFAPASGALGRAVLLDVHVRLTAKLSVLPLPLLARALDALGGLAPAGVSAYYVMEARRLPVTQTFLTRGMSDGQHGGIAGGEGGKAAAAGAVGGGEGAGGLAAEGRRLDGAFMAAVLRRLGRELTRGSVEPWVATELLCAIARFRSWPGAGGLAAVPPGAAGPWVAPAGGAPAGPPATTSSAVGGASSARSSSPSPACASSEAVAAPQLPGRGGLVAGSAPAGVAASQGQGGQAAEPMQAVATGSGMGWPAQGSQAGRPSGLAPRPRRVPAAAEAETAMNAGLSVSAADPQQQQQPQQLQRPGPPGTWGHNGPLLRSAAPPQLRDVPPRSHGTPSSPTTSSSNGNRRADVAVLSPDPNTGILLHLISLLPPPPAPAPLLASPAAQPAAQANTPPGQQHPQPLHPPHPSQDVSPSVRALWAMARLRYRPAVPWVTALLAATYPRLAPPAPQPPAPPAQPPQPPQPPPPSPVQPPEVARTSWRKRRAMGLEPGQSRPSGPLKPQQLVQLWWALGEVGWAPGRQWREAALRGLAAAVAPMVPPPPVPRKRAAPSTAAAAASGPGSEAAGKRPAAVGAAAAAAAGARSAGEEVPGEVQSQRPGDGAPPGGVAGGGLTRAELCMVVAAFGRWKVAAPAKWMEGFLKAVKAALPRFDAPSISALCVALARANYRPRAAFVRALLAQSARQLPYADASGALQVLWALRHMGLYSEVDGSGCLPPGWRAAFLDCTYELMQVTLRSYPPPPRRHRFHLAYSLALEPPPVRLGASRESQGSSTSSGGSGGGSSGQTQEPATTPGKQRSGTGKNVKPSGGSRSSAAANSSSAAASGTARAPKAPTVAPAPAPIPAGRGGSAARRARGFSPSQLSLLLLLVGKAGVRPGPNWRHAFWATSFAALPHMGPGALATLLQGVLRLRVVPPRWWQRAYFTASAEAMPRSSASCLVQYANAVLRSPVNPRTPHGRAQWVTAFRTHLDLLMARLTRPQRTVCLRVVRTASWRRAGSMRYGWREEVGLRELREMRRAVQRGEAVGAGGEEQKRREGEGEGEGRRQLRVVVGRGRGERVGRVRWGGGKARGGRRRGREVSGRGRGGEESWGGEVRGRSREGSLGGEERGRSRGGRWRGEGRGRSREGRWRGGRG